MKLITSITACVFPFACWAQTADFTVNVRLNTLPVATKAYLHYEANGQQKLDSALVVNGVFSFKGVVAEPVQAQLLLDHSGEGLQPTLAKKKSDVVDFFIEKGTTTFSGRDSVKTAAISSAMDINKQYARYLEQSVPFNEAMATLNAEFAAASAERRKQKEFVAGLDARAKIAAENKSKLLSSYIRQNPSGFFSLEALNELAGPDLEASRVEPLFNGLSSKLRNTTDGLAFAKRIASSKIVAIGKNAPQFIQNDVTGNPVTLSQFKGKYVLLDFWASWCAPCRKENPNLVKAYHQYKEKNFTVLGVSLDAEGKKDDWLKAIKTDGLEWTQVSDLHSFNNAVAKQYGVSAIPQNFLIDPSGKIIAKNLVGDELNKKLAEIFGS